MKKKSVIVGCTSGVGRALVDNLFEAGHDLFLVGRQMNDLDEIRKSFLPAKLEKQKVTLFCADLEQIDAGCFFRKAIDELGQIDNLFFDSRILFDRKDFQRLEVSEINKLVWSNFLGHIHILQAFYDYIKSANHEINIVGISSAACMRPRNQNTIYAASKRAFEFYLNGLAQDFSESRVRIQLYRLGFIRTRMSKSAKSVIPFASAEETSKMIFDNLGSNIQLRYYPKFWFLISIIYSCIPRFIFSKMKRRTHETK
ncbi:MAG: SDR family NAD(P)-dependent oxidoreductase [Bdellovibrionales bacterium]|nr:SDR family NAD(P)-dependent oxidoreductase [Bdellovibrionales bacterium]